MLRNEPVEQARSPRFRCDGRNSAVTFTTASRRCCAAIETRLASGFLDYSGACTDGQIL